MLLPTAISSAHDWANLNSSFSSNLESPNSLYHTRTSRCWTKFQSCTLTRIQTKHAMLHEIGNLKYALPRRNWHYVDKIPLALSFSVIDKCCYQSIENLHIYRNGNNIFKCISQGRSMIASAIHKHIRIYVWTHWANATQTESYIAYMKLPLMKCLGFSHYQINSCGLHI